LSENAGNWSTIIIDGIKRGEVLKPELTGIYSVVDTYQAVGQAYWDAKVSGEHQAIGLVIAPDLTLPVRGISIYPLAGEDSQTALQRAFDGQVTLEHQTQPNVCTLEITNSIQAVSGNEQTVGQDMWQAEKLTPKQAAEKFGRDAWSQNPENWKIVDNGFGVKLAVNPNGSNSIVEMNGAIGQAYWDAKVLGEHQAIAGTLGVGVIAPVRGITVYSGVPTGIENTAVGNAFAKAVNLEIGTQPGVYVVLVSKSDCPTGETTSHTNPSATAAPKAEATAMPKASQTAKPEATPNPTNWMLPFEKSLGERAHPVKGFSNGLKIELGKKVKVTITKGERIDTPMGSFNGPWGGYVTVATIWKLN
jgi:hypothetical protein